MWHAKVSGRARPAHTACGREGRRLEGGSQTSCQERGKEGEGGREGAGRIVGSATTTRARAGAGAFRVGFTCKGCHQHSHSTEMPPETRRRRAPLALAARVARAHHASLAQPQEQTRPRTPPVCTQRSLFHGVAVRAAASGHRRRCTLPFSDHARDGTPPPSPSFRVRRPLWGGRATARRGGSPRARGRCPPPPKDMAYAERPLFGGAIVAKLPAGFKVRAPATPLSRCGGRRQTRSRADASPRRT